MDPWEDRLTDFLSEDGEKWDDKLCEDLVEQGFIDISAVAVTPEDVARSCHALIKNNGGVFKSEAQAKFLHQVCRRFPRLALAKPERWFPAFDPTTYTAVRIVARVPGTGGLNPKKARFFAYGFILDPHGVCCRIKFRVNVKPDDERYGQVDFDSGEVNFLKDL